MMLLDKARGDGMFAHFAVRRTIFAEGDITR